MTESDECAAALVAQLGAQGVREIVVCPGSRSGPLALAAFASERAGLVRLHVRVDERGAGFLALGLAKASERPVAVVTTSGTAAGNLLPAVMEAAHAGAPLIAVTADRPASLTGFGANQTTAQAGIFGSFVRWAAQVDSRAQAASWTAQAARAALVAQGLLGTLPGPVHLNVHLDLPLVGDAPVTLPSVRPRRAAGRTRPDPLVLVPGPRTVALCGDASPAIGRRVAAMAGRTGTPLIAEPSSNARFGVALATGRVLLDSELAGEIERVVIFGHPTLSRSVSRLLARDDVEIVVEGSAAGWPDPGWRATVFADEVVLPDADADWAEGWRVADIAAQGSSVAAWRLDDQREEQDDVVVGAVRDPGGLTGLTAARTLWKSLSGDDVLVVGASNPIRDLDLAPVGPSSPHVFANRGLAGIDGTVSTALGVALATGAPTTAYLGDLTFLHDASALALGGDEPRPDLRIVVADDRGGSIFATLEYRRPAFAAAFERMFATPTLARPAEVARGYGIPVAEVGSSAELEAALREPVVGLSVLVVRLDRAGRG